MKPRPVIAIIDVGKTNKKLLLFDEDYNLVYEHSAQLIEIVDEDGDACENIESLRLFVFESLRQVFSKKEFVVKAINFSAYGASFVYVDEEGRPLTPLYNYLKAYPEQLHEQFYSTYGGEEEMALCTASPLLGSLNSGLQLYRIKYEKPQVFSKIRYALHLPQYISYLISNKACSDITSIGCHTHLWDFHRHSYHHWVQNENIEEKLAPVVVYDQVCQTAFHGNNCVAGTGLHDSSAALIPYLVNFNEPFVLISTGTWCISLNPFNYTPLTIEELQQDCLCYLQHQGKPVKASRLFAGKEHEEGIQRIADYFNQDSEKYQHVNFDPAIIEKLKNQKKGEDGDILQFKERELQYFLNYEEAYHRLMMDIVGQQVRSTQLLFNNFPVKRLFVDGGFSRNRIYMNLLAAAFSELEIYSASMAQASALGAAMAIHKAWNKKPVPNTLIQLQFYSIAKEVV